MTERLEREEFQVLTALAQVCGNSRIEQASSDEINIHISRPIPISVTTDILDCLEAKELVFSDRNSEKARYGLTRGGFACLGSTFRTPNGVLPTTRILVALAESSLKDRIEYVSVNRISDCLVLKIPLGALIDYLTELVDGRLIRKMAKANSAGYALTRLGFERVRIYRAMETYLKGLPRREGYVAMWLGMQGLSVSASDLIEEFVGEGILSRCSPDQWRLR